MSLTSFNQLLHLLADGKFHSGKELGELLHVSRAAIWKQLQGAEALGLVLHRVRGKGYRIPGGLDLLDIEAILRFRPELKTVFNFHLLMSTQSTNLVLMQELGKHSIRGEVVLAEVQRAGRGRLGRQWYSPFAQQVSLSVGWQFPTIQSLEGLSLLIGLATAKALAEMGVNGLSLKWPNDILLNGHKLAGILIELQAEATGACQVVIGLGVNVHMLENENIDQAWTSLRANGYVVSRSHLVATILHYWNQDLIIFAQYGFGYFQKTWQSYNAFQDKEIVCINVTSQQVGRCKGVDEHGALMIETNNKISTIHAGEVSIRLTEGNGVVAT